MRILIAGCGEIGTRVGLELHTKGHQVFGLKRNIETIPAQIVPICADLSSPIEIQRLPGAIDLVIFILAAGGFNEQAYHQSYVLAAKHLIDALDDNLKRLKRFVFVSSTSVYAQNDGQWVDEDSVTEPAGFNGQIMLQAEQQILTLANPLVVRFSGIYGPGRMRMLNQVKSGQLAPPQPAVFSNRIHVDDCVGVLLHLIELARLPHKLILASDCEPVPLNEIQTWLADELAVPQHERQYRAVQRRAGSKRICNKRLLSLGYRFSYPDYRSGYRAILKR